MLLLLLSLFFFSALAMLVHEAGHLIAARHCRVTTTELALGFGPVLFSFTVGSIRFSMRAIPLGSFVRLDGTALNSCSIAQQLCVHLGGIALNLIVGFVALGTTFGWLNFVVAAGNILPIYQHDGWKCGLVIMRAFLKRRSQPVEWAFTFSGGFVSLLIAWAVVRMFI